MQKDTHSGSLFPSEEMGANSSEARLSSRPLAERMRPVAFDEFVGQSHLIGTTGSLRPLMDSGNLHSMIFWGDPGQGKTTLARLLATNIDAEFIQISAVTSGVQDVRSVITHASTALKTNRRTLLFIDEIHRFNKAQQDALLHAVEDGTLTLIGATTENPSFEVIAPLLSRCSVYRFHPLAPTARRSLLKRVFKQDDWVSSSGLKIAKEAESAMVDLALGDARELMNLLERSVEHARHSEVKTITLELLETVAAQSMSRYDKSGERHFDTISAFIKCVRNSDPDAAVYWLARMLDGGEDPLFVARRLVILAAEDIGNANPNGLLLANAGFDSVHRIGMPEARIILSQVTTYLAASEKSNAAYVAINTALEVVRKGKQPVVPLHLRNAPTRLMKDHGYSDGYRYAHSEELMVSPMPGLPSELEGTKFYYPKDVGTEAKIKQRLKMINVWKEETVKREASIKGKRAENPGDSKA